MNSSVGLNLNTTECHGGSQKGKQKWRSRSGLDDGFLQLEVVVERVPVDGRQPRLVLPLQTATAGRRMVEGVGQLERNAGHVGRLGRPLGAASARVQTVRQRFYKRINE